MKHAEIPGEGCFRARPEDNILCGPTCSSVALPVVWPTEEVWGRDWRTHHVVEVGPREKTWKEGRVGEQGVQWYVLRYSEKYREV